MTIHGLESVNIGLCFLFLYHKSDRLYERYLNSTIHEKGQFLKVSKTRFTGLNSELVQT